MGLIPGSGIAPKEGHGNPLQYSCLENPMYRGAWQTTVHGSQRVRHDKLFSMHACIIALTVFKHYCKPFAFMCVLVAQSSPAFCDPIDCNPPGSSVHGILHERILEWTTISLSRRSSQPRDQTQVSCIAGRLFTI